MEFFIKMIMITNNSINNQVKIYLIKDLLRVKMHKLRIWVSEREEWVEIG